MKKKLLLLALCAVASGSMLEAWYGGGWRRGGWGYGRGWGYGAPALGFGVTVPVGGSGPRRPAAVQQYKRETGSYPSSKSEFCSWANRKFTDAKAKEVCDQYESYQEAPRSEPRGAISFGVGGGGYGYPYGYGYGSPFGLGFGW